MQQGSCTGPHLCSRCLLHEGGELLCLDFDGHSPEAGQHVRQLRQEPGVLQYTHTIQVLAEAMAASYMCTQVGGKRSVQP